MFWQCCCLDCVNWIILNHTRSNYLYLNPLSLNHLRVNHSRLKYSSSDHLSRNQLRVNHLSLNHLRLNHSSMNQCSSSHPNYFHAQDSKKANYPCSLKGREGVSSVPVNHNNTSQSWTFLRSCKQKIGRYHFTLNALGMLHAQSKGMLVLVFTWLLAAIWWERLALWVEFV